MPLYEYECQACGNRIEAQQRMADAALKTCPKCGKDELQRLISATAFHLKGGGWYKDLYSSSKPGEGGSGKPGEGGSDGGVPTNSPAPATTATPSGGDSSSSPAPAATPAPTSTPTSTSSASGGSSSGKSGGGSST